MTAPLLIIVGCLLQASSLAAWTWDCVGGQCVRSTSPDDETPAKSQAVCRLTCGQYGALWPQPTGNTVISDKVLGFNLAGVEMNFSAVADINKPPVQEFMTSVSKVFLDKLTDQCDNNCRAEPDTSVNIYIATTSSDTALNWLTDESYTLEISTRENKVTVEIQAGTMYGARHGLETLSQLIGYIPVNKQLIIVTTAKVSDKPAYPHRGLLLDTSRHYLPISALKRNLDAMGASKLNVLHWHATDSHSFPLSLPRVPEMARYGAYSPEEVYTLDDIKMLINYARARGIRIMLELDMPAHAGNGWQWGGESGYGELAVCVNKQPWRQYCLQPPCGQLNPANPNLYRVMRDIFRDFLEVLPPGEIMHMGGDEVYFPCWNQSTEVTDWMKSQGKGVSESDFLDVWEDLHNKAMQVWDEEVGNSKTPILLWTSHLTNPATIKLNKERFVIQAWTDTYDPTASQLLQMGYRMIMSTRDAWYLDHGFWGRTSYYSWRRAYDNMLPRHRGVLGGEAAMWGELVDDNNVDARVWPRAASAAERLWTNPATDNTQAESRMIEHRERLVRLGVQAEAITPQWCAQNQGLCAGSANIY